MGDTNGERHWGPSWGVAIVSLGVGVAGILVVWLVNYWQAFG